MSCKLARLFVVPMILVVSPLSAQEPEPPLEDTRLSIHTLVREDVFAGWREQDMQRFARGERNIDILLKKRPAARADLLAWKGGARLFRAVLAYEADETEAFERYLQEAQEKSDFPFHAPSAAWR